jgi:hypothetical protein
LEYRINLNLLQATYTILHISDVFLPLIPVSSSLMPMSPDSAWNQQGRITAEFVRYLRIHHYTPPYASPVFQELQSARQPEGFGRPFWELVEGFIVTGSLTQAWDLLQRHSMYQRGAQLQREQEDLGVDENMDSEEFFLAKRAAETFRTFEAIHDIMIRAPLPGGRNLDHDESVSLGLPVEELDDLGVYSDELSVQPSDYRQWEHPTSTVSASYSLQQQSIMDKYRTWQDYVKETRRTLPPGRGSELTQILALLSGDFSDYTFTTWSEALLADLLFRTPDMRPRDLVKRARKFIRIYSPELKHELTPILSIMEGNAANAIHLLHAFGGTNGAAVPTTMVRCD